MRILIIEDEINLADALSEIIKAEKYLYDTVYDGKNGLEYAKSGIYDCIILDWMLPEIDGLELLKELRKNKISTPVLMLTAKDSIKDKVTGLDAGADDYMTKPFSSEELLARLRTLMRRRSEIIPNELRFSDLIFSQDSLEIKNSTNGKAIRLSFKESEILKLLLASPKIIIPKEELIVKVWGYDTDTSDNNVEAYISFIRKKLTFIGSSVQIVSVKKIGYTLENNEC